MTKSELEKLAKQAKKGMEAKEKPKQVVVKTFEEKVSETTPKKPKKEPIVWDVKIGDPIEYFDPDLSYEVTGYRPINDTRGLDFDPNPFSEMAQLFEKSGYYTTYLPKSKLYNDFWTEEYRKCQDGVTYNGYTITGDHYFFLNYYRMKTPVKGLDNIDGSKFEETFPTFCTEQYKWFHYVALCEYTNLDCNALKPRGVGWSEIAASMGLRNYTIKRQSQGIYTAFNTDLLSNTIAKIWDGMEFLNTSTRGGMKRLRMVKNTAEVRRASQKLKDGTEIGFKSEVRTVITDNPRKLRGSRVERLFFEESGSHPLLLKTYSQGQALVEVGATKVGMRFTWGTGGDSGPALAGLASIFYDPKAFNVLPYKHTNNLQKEVVYTGFFIPAWAMVWQCMDHRGFCSEEKGRRYYDKNRLEKSNNAEALMIYKSEYCYVPEEALIREGNNRFDSEKLAEQLANIELHKIVKPPIKGTLSWPLDTSTGKHDFTKRPSFNLGESSKLEIVEYPMCDEHAIPYANLYCAGIDSIDGDASTSSQANSGDVSDFCIVIKKRQFGISEPKYVAIYKDRPKDVRTAYDNAFKLLQWYNCKAVVEATRVGIITYFKEKNSLNYLFKRPRATLSNPTSQNIKQYGALATPAVIDHQLELIEQFVYDYSHTIDFPQMIQELLKYSYENKRKFDIVAAMGMCELADEEMYGKSIKESTTQKEWRDIGYYYDEYGRKKYGVIPKR